MGIGTGKVLKGSNYLELSFGSHLEDTCTLGKSTTVLLYDNELFLCR